MRGVIARPVLGVITTLSLNLGCTSSNPNSGTQTPETTSSSALDAAVIDDDAGVAGAITGLQPLRWTWVPFVTAHCRDGSSTGLGLNVNPNSDKLMIFLEGGGACFNITTCALNPAVFGATEFQQFASDGSVGNAGVFNRDDPDNPVRDWSYVYVPYCTGDVHSGNNPQGSVNLVGPQQFVGYANMGSYLSRIVPTFPNVTQVLLAGVSAGGFGALANYLQVTKQFDPVSVSLLDDSGPPMDAPYFPACLAHQITDLWRLDQTIVAECGADCANIDHLMFDLTQHALSAYSATPVGLLESTGDSVISWFFGFGANDCTGTQNMGAQTFAEGLTDLRQKLSAYSNFGTFVFSGTDHTSLEAQSSLDTRQAAGAKLTDYISQLIAGQVTNVGP